MAGDQDTRERLLDAAGPVFAEHGFQHATVREICGQAEVNVASVNYHFGDKETLYQETVRRARMERSRQFPFPEWQSDVAPASKLAGFVHTILSRMLSPSSPWQSRLMMREVFEPSDLCRDLVNEFFRPDFELLMNIVRELVPGKPAEYQIRQLAFGIIGQCLVYRAAGPIIRRMTPEEEMSSHYSIDQLAEWITCCSLTMCEQFREPCRVPASP